MAEGIVALVVAYNKGMVEAVASSLVGVVVDKEVVSHMDKVGSRVAGMGWLRGKVDTH